jgi:hypothetical protein
MADLLQFLVNTPVRPRGKFAPGGVLTDLDGPAGGTCTVTLTKPDGSAGPASGTVSHVATGVYDFALDGPSSPMRYDVAWSGQLGGKNVTVTTQVEALGEFVFYLPDFRELRVGNGKPFKDETAWPAERVLDARTAVLEELQRILWFAPVPRYALEVLDGDATPTVALPHYEARRPTAAAVDGVALTATELADLSVKGRMLTRAHGARWAWGTANIQVEYVHGWPMPLGDCANMAMLMAAQRLDPSVLADATSVLTPDGSSYSFDPAGQVTRAGTVRHTGIARLDAWLQRHAVA